MWLQGCRLQLPLLLAVHDRGGAAVPAGRLSLRSALSALEQWTAAGGDNTQTHACTNMCLHTLYTNAAC